MRWYREEVRAPLVLDGATISRRETVFVSSPGSGQIQSFLAHGSHRLVLSDRRPLARNPADINGL